MQMGEGYDLAGFDLEELRQKKHPVTWKAFLIAFNRRKEDVEEGRPPFHVTIVIDCDGCPVPTSVSGEGSQMMAQSCPGAEWSYPHYTNYFAYGRNPLAGFLLDKRSWLDILRGCCPNIR